MTSDGYMTSEGYMTSDGYMMSSYNTRREDNMHTQVK